MCYNELMDVRFKHIILEGTSYEIGKFQGELFKKGIEDSSDYFPPVIEKAGLSEAEFLEAYRFYEGYCPGINEEIQGFADGMELPVEQVAYYTSSLIRMGNCGHFAVLPQITENGHTYVGRSYEWGLNDALRLCTTRVKGKAAHIGFSFGIFGRLDGINEYGLCVTMSNGVPGPDPQLEGLKFWGVVRALLDHCKTVSEGLEMIKDMPISSNLNLILTDRNGEAALVEIAPPHRAIRRINSASEEKYICSTNHLTQPDMLPYDIGRRWFSVTRYETIETGLKLSSPKVNKASMKNILSQAIPEGICAYYYEEGFGTLWSIVFDLTEASAEICFGSPLINQWNMFHLDDTAGVKEYDAQFPLESVENPSIFWKLMN